MKNAKHLLLALVLLTGIEVVDMTKYESSLKKIAELGERVVAARSLPNLYRRPAGRN